MRFCRSASKLAPAATHVSPARVSTIVLPPETMVGSVVAGVIVPVAVAVAGGTNAMSKFGVATIGLAPVTALAGTVAVIVSFAVVS